ncbi:MAG: hypothetical protein AABX54_04360 [Nanoarchaeota archaeon]
MEETNNQSRIICPYAKCPDYGLAKICYLKIYHDCNIIKNKTVQYRDGRYVPNFPLSELEILNL